MAPVTKPKVTLGKTFLREYRRLANLSQEVASRELRISRGLLSQIENAKSPYTQRLLERASTVYGCTPTELLAGPKHPVDKDLLRRLIIEIEDVLAKAPDVGKISPVRKAEIVVELFSFLALQGNRSPEPGEVEEFIRGR